jgi:hypothetical protein
VSGASRQAKFRARARAYRRVYLVELVDVTAEHLVSSFGYDLQDMPRALTALLEDLEDKLSKITRHGCRLRFVLSLEKRELRIIVVDKDKDK